LNVLVIEDDSEVAAYLDSELSRRGYDVTLVATLAGAASAVNNDEYDVIVLDRMLPDGDGLAFIEDVRGRGSTVPILVLSALGEVNHRVEGLRAGGDDYLVKPFDVTELTARLEVLNRRVETQKPVTEFGIGDLVIDLLSRRVSRGGEDIRLQPREFKLLEYLARHCGQVVTRAMLLEAVWGIQFDPQTNVVDVHISRLRNKIDAGFSAPLLHTVRGEGYRLAEAP